MNDLQQAYFDLGLPSGSSLEAINVRYKRLIMVWHPDRMNNDDGRRVADEEMKKINNAKDVLKRHFDSGDHRDTGACACRSAAGPQSQAFSRTQGGPGPGPRRTRNTEEQQREDAAARKRDEERAGGPRKKLGKKLHTRQSKPLKLPRKKLLQQRSGMNMTESSTCCDGGFQSVQALYSCCSASFLESLIQW